MAGQLSPAEQFINKATQAPDATLDVTDIQTARTEEAEIVEQAKKLAKDARQKLSKEIAEAANGSGDTIEKQELQDLADAIDAIPEPAAAIPQPDALEAGIPALNNAAKMGENFIQKIGSHLESFSSGTLLSVASFFGNFESPFFKSIANYLKGFAEPRAIRDAMKKKLGVNVEKTSEDSAHLETLRAQYQTKLETESKDAKNYSFQTFYTQKIEQLAGTPKASYTLADLANLPSAEEAKSEKEKEQAKEEEKKKDEKKERLNTPELRKTAYVIALAQAFNDVIDGFIPLTETDPAKTDLTELTKLVLQKITGEAAISTLGIDVDGGDLEEADGTNWFYDTDAITYFEKNLKENPEIAVKDVLHASFSSGRSKTTMPQVQDALRKRIAESGLDDIRPSAPADAPVETPPPTDA